MNTHGNSLRVQAGFGMIEVLVTLIILLTGLLGLAGLQAQGQRSELESYQRIHALILLQDMESRINANRKVAACYALTTDATGGTPYLGVSATASPACSSGTIEQQTRATQDMQDWSALLAGAAETSEGGGNIGAMVGARGCVSLIDAATQTYLVSVAWQGVGKTAAPPAGLGCAKDLYGDETQRRVVSITLRVADLG
jgi:type IV pilus assembly protein PilV